MEYISVIWKHSDGNDPVRLISELDGERFEQRKLEFFGDGTVGGASTEFANGRTVLGTVAVPALSEINEDPQFDGIAITKAEFDRLWHEHAPTTTFRR